MPSCTKTHVVSHKINESPRLNTSQSPQNARNSARASPGRFDWLPSKTQRRRSTPRTNDTAKSHVTASNVLLITPHNPQYTSSNIKPPRHHNPISQTHSGRFHTSISCAAGAGNRTAPKATMATPLLKPATATGVVRSVVEPSPSCTDKQIFIQALQSQTLPPSRTLLNKIYP